MTSPTYKRDKIELARRVVAFVRANPSCSMRTLMLEFEKPERTIQTAIAIARRQLDVPIASIRFGAQGQETYYEVRDAFPAEEARAA